MLTDELRKSWLRIRRLFRAVASEDRLALSSPRPYDYVQEKKLVESSSLFDAEWYVDRYPDVADTGMSPVEHYLRRGSAEGRSPGPNFDAVWYLKQNPDVAAAKVNPLVHYIQYGAGEGRMQRPPAHSEKYLFKAATPQPSGTTIIRASQRAASSVHPTDAPVPPAHLMEYAETPEKHLEMGKADFELLHGILENSSKPFGDADRILDFGCSNARVTRWMIPYTDKAEIWGADLQADKIFWAMEHLCPPLRFITNTVVPHLPFADGAFSIIIAQSVFTHIVELHGAWLLELARLLKPTGVMFLTLNDQVAFSADPAFFSWIFRGFEAQLEQTPFDRLDFAAINPYGREGLSHVYMSERYMRKLLPPGLEIEKVVPKAFGPGQTGYLVKKI